MVNLRNCQARVDAERNARCNLEVGRNQLFCPAHNAEYEALAARASAAAVVLKDLGRSMDALLTEDLGTYTTHEGIQEDLGRLERYLQALDDRIGARTTLSRRFFTERECPLCHICCESSRVTLG